MKILGIETSCDETAVGIVEDGYKLLANCVQSSMDLHAKYGGVVPEIAARSHIEAMIPVLEEALKEAKLSWKDIDGISCTYGAGLGGSLLIGVMTAKTLCSVLNKPLLGANHVLGHVYANYITESNIQGYKVRNQSPEFPFLAVIVSGGHTQLVYFKDHFKYIVLGKTLDDAIGEAFDKVAKILGLPYPGGVSISKIAPEGNGQIYKLPIPNVDGYNFSFSGLKTAVLRLAQQEIGENYTFPSISIPNRLKMSQKANIAASFQHTAIQIIIQKLKKALIEFKPKTILLAGGVAANQLLREEVQKLSSQEIEFLDTKLCTDNGAMIAALGCFLYQQNNIVKDLDLFSIEPNLKM